MDRFYVFLIRNDVWIYILSVLGIFWYLTELIRARYLLRRAMFGLERETGRQKRNNALIYITLLSAIILGIFYVNRQIAPTLPPDLFRPPTPTPDIFSTPLSSPTSLSTPPSSPTIPLAATVTLASDNPAGPLLGNSENSPDTAVTPEINALDSPLPEIEAGTAAQPAAEPLISSTPFIGCISLLNITQPKDGSVASDEIIFIGTANISNFQYYTMEINGPQTNGQWASLLGRNQNQPVEDSFLGQAN